MTWPATSSQIQDRTPGSGVLANPAAFSVQDPVLAGLLASGDALLRQFTYDPHLPPCLGDRPRMPQHPVPRPVTDDPRCGYNSGSFGTLNQDNAPSMTDAVHRELCLRPGRQPRHPQPPDTPQLPGPATSASAGSSPRTGSPPGERTSIPGATGTARRRPG